MTQELRTPRRRKKAELTDLDLLKRSIDIKGHAQALGLVFDSKNQVAHCPAHEDEHPSLKFYTDKSDGVQKCKCFSCNFQGNVIDLHMQVKNLEFGAAVRELAEKAGIAIAPARNEAADSSNGRRKGRKTEAKPTTTEAAGPNSEAPTASQADPGQSLAIFQDFESFCGPPDGAALDYLTGRSRGLWAETISRFRIFTVKDYGAAQDYLAGKYTMDDLIASGLFNKNKHLVFYAHTIIIPFFDASDELFYLRGRYFKDGSPNPDAKDVGKMLGLSGPTSKQLYNIGTLKGLEDGSTVYLAEGEFDAMILEQYGYKAVGLPGMTNWDSSWMPKTLKNYCVEICLDNPKPGRLGPERANEAKNIDEQVFKIASSLWDAGNTQTYRPQMPMDFKDMTDLFIDLKGEFAE